MLTPLRWTDTLELLDQRKLPLEERWVRCTTLDEVADAIRSMVIRGAPAIGITASFGVVLGAREGKTWEAVYDSLSKTRPTAYNLFWALQRMETLWKETEGDPLALEREAKKIWEEDIQANQAMGERGKTLLKDAFTFMTICNAGALATGGYGTALGVLRSLHEEKTLSVWVPETRPYLQGARLTCWELLKEGIRATLITDNMVGFCMKKHHIDACIVGADRIAKNGDTANKIGTYQMAQLAKIHGIPFYVVAPESTLDRSLPSGEDIPIEVRSPDEVYRIAGKVIAPQGIKVWHPAFDITPASLISGIITERSIYFPPFAF